MSKIGKNKIFQIAEAVFWLFIIIATIVVMTRLDWATASNFVQFMAAIALLVSVYFYLKNRSLLNESQQKTMQLMQKQRELRDRQKTIDLIFNNSADGILILDQDKRIEEFSPGMEFITGYSRDEAMGRDAQQLLRFSAGKNKSLLPDLMFTLRGTNHKAQYIENSLVGKIGKIIDIEASHTLIHDNKKNKTLALAIIRDISYEKELIERDKEFITVTSHQLNTPLSIIRGYASLLNSGKAGEMNKKQSDFIKQILSSTEKMIALTNSMLSISRIEQEKIKLDIGDVNIRDIIDLVVKMFEQKAADKGIGIVVKMPQEQVVIMADAERLSQALSNFIDNAIKYTLKGRVTISVVDHPEVIDIMVADTGMGIPQQELEKIGMRFYRTQEAIDVDNRGTGLGFFIAQTIIEKHHGHLRVESKQGQFTKVIINLPKKQPL